MKTKKADYSLFNRKIFYRVSLILSITGLTLFLLQKLLRGNFGPWLVDYLQKNFHLSEENAFYFHQFLIRNNLLTLSLIVIVISLIAVFWLYTKFITQYFDEIASGLDQMLEDSQEPVSLPLELASLASKMNLGKQELLRKEVAAKDALRRKDDLVVYLAHDIRTPLTSIIGYLSLLEESPDLAIEQRAKFTNITLTKAYALESLINEFFDITRFNIHEVVLFKEQLDLNLLVAQLADEFQLNSRQEGKELLVETTKPCLIEADGEKIGRSIGNIIKNALTYSQVDSQILLEVSQSDEFAIVTCQNFGKTIPKEMQKNIFDKFYRLDRARSAETGGSGLGLAIAKDLIEAHQGRISVASHEGETTFTVELPLNHQRKVAETAKL